MPSWLRNGVPSTSIETTGIVAIDALLGYGKWGGAIGQGAAITYSMFATGAQFAYRPADNPVALPNLVQDACRAVLDDWGSLVPLTFSELTETATDVGDIRFTMGDLPQYTLGYAYYPADTASGGDVFLSTDIFAASAATPGTMDHYTVLHEVGHALGLRHPFDYDHDRPTMPEATAGVHFTVMAYPYLDTRGVTRLPTTPMLYDIVAIQYLYGANLLHAQGDDTYVFDGTGEYLQTIWDSAGVDTIRATGGAGCVIDLTPGRFSALGRPIVYDDGSIERDTVAIAFDCWIENAIGGNGADRLLGNMLANRLTGGRGDDTLRGGAGADTLLGGGGTNRLVGGAGDDVYRARAGDVILEQRDGGEDTAQINGSYTLPTGVETLRLTGTGNWRGTGNAQDNALLGNAGANLLRGAAGGDVLSGGGGVDTLVGGAGHDFYDWDGTDRILEQAGGGVDTLSAAMDAVLPGNVEILRLERGDWAGTGNAAANQLFGSQGDNLLSGRAGDDELHGLDGDDTLRGGDGDDVFHAYRLGSLPRSNGNDVFDGGAGFDWVRYELALTGVSIDLAAAGRQDTWTMGLDTFVDVEGVAGSNHDDRLRGDRRANALHGLGGDDRLWGGGGDDTLLGGDGDDMLVGGGGNNLLNGGKGYDIAHFLAVTEDVRIDLGSQGPQHTGKGYDVLLDVEIVWSGSGNDTLLGASRADILWGGDGNDAIAGGRGDDLLGGEAGHDVLDGGAGRDGASYADATVGVAVDLRIAGRQNTGAGRDMLISIEDLYGGDGNDSLTGNGGGNVLVGGAGDDVLSGAAGADELWGGGGGDTLIGGAGADLFCWEREDRGSDVINDFDLSQDRIDLRALGVTDLAAVQFMDDNGSAVLHLANGITARLSGVASSALTTGNFVLA